MVADSIFGLPDTLSDEEVAAKRGAVIMALPDTRTAMDDLTAIVERHHLAPVVAHALLGVLARALVGAYVAGAGDAVSYRERHARTTD